MKWHNRGSIISYEVENMINILHVLLIRYVKNERCLYERKQCMNRCQVVNRLPNQKNCLIIVSMSADEEVIQLRLLIYNVHLISRKMTILKCHWNYCTAISNENWGNNKERYLIVDSGWTFRNTKRSYLWQMNEIFSATNSTCSTYFMKSTNNLHRWPL